MIRFFKIENIKVKSVLLKVLWSFFQRCCADGKPGLGFMQIIRRVIRITIYTAVYIFCLISVFNCI